MSWSSEKKYWRTYIRQENRSVYIGKYTTEEEAARAFDKKAKELRGEFACLNFPEG
ncbi:MAG: hypothetical protein JXA82_08840 [Sedimentisphaerales bacterium]|nr:hypothetical protein [Sedimentisphaerales bacterium]